MLSTSSFHVPLGRLLIARGALSECDLAAGLTYAAANGVKLGQALIVLGLIDERGLSDALRQQGKVHCIQLTPRIVDRTVACELGAERARGLNALPINRIAGVTTVAMEDPSDSFGVDELEAQLGTPVLAVHAEPARIRESIDAVFGASAPALDHEPAPAWASAMLAAAPSRDSSILVLEPRGAEVRVHALASDAHCSLTMPADHCALALAELLATHARREACAEAEGAKP